MNLAKKKLSGRCKYWGGGVFDNTLKMVNILVEKKVDLQNFNYVIFS